MTRRPRDGGSLGTDIALGPASAPGIIPWARSVVRTSIVLVTVLAATLLACGGSEPAGPAQASAARLRFSVEQVSLGVGGSGTVVLQNDGEGPSGPVQLTATALVDGAGSPVSSSTLVVTPHSLPNLAPGARVDVRILVDWVAALETGEYSGSVEAASSSSRASVHVAVSVSESEELEDRLAAIELSPAWPATFPGAAIPLTARGIERDGGVAEGVTFTWSSSDAAVARVDPDGRVTGIAPGEAVITVEGKEASADLTVTVVEEAFTSVAASGLSTCGIVEGGQALCWGGGLGLGNGSFESVPFPVTVRGPLFESLYGGSGGAMCGVTPEDQPYCWGWNLNAELGTEAPEACETPNGSPASCSALPLPVQGGPFAWAGSLYKHGCGLEPDGRAHCWGFNPAGQAGASPNQQIVFTPRPLDTALRFTAIQGGFAHTCGLASDGSVHCWGGPGYMTLDEDQPHVPRLVAGNRAFSRVAADGWAACGLTDEGEAWCWGLNERLELGAESTAECQVQGEVFPCSVEPLRVGGGHTFTELSMTWHTVCALDETGAAWCWGDNEFGQRGSGAPDTQLAEPQPVLGGHRFTQLAAGRRHTCGLAEDGTIYCWGLNETGQLGMGHVSMFEIEPQRILGPRG